MSTPLDAHVFYGAKYTTRVPHSESRFPQYIALVVIFSGNVKTEIGSDRKHQQERQYASTLLTSLRALRVNAVGETKVFEELARADSVPPSVR